tara:strand:- start:328937 stop:330799 length:1863 start_codon:yes stop_codon:yes gene_type:complete
MGGVPVLLLLAAMGITYGWQPDGNGGVEYIIQIPPDQLDELQQSGELTSVINPKVQAHVSRVVVKVGDETLHEITPPELNQTAKLSHLSSVRTAAHDGSPVPIPEIREQVMKPAGGFDLPDTLNDAATRAAGNLRTGVDDFTAEMQRRAANAGTDQARATANELQNRAGNALRNAADTLLGRGGNNATASNPQLPNFTGADPASAAALSRQGVASTDPTGQRDQNWYGPDGRLRRPTTDPVDSNRELVGPPDPRSSTGAASANSNFTNPLAQAAAERARADQLRTDQLRTEQARAEQLRAEQARVEQARAEQLRAEQERARLAAQERSTGFGTTSNFGRSPIGMSGGSAGNADPRLASTSNDSRFGGNEPTYGTAFGAQTAGVSQNMNVAASVDPRLTAEQVAQLPSGGWSFDAYGRPIDRDGRVLDQWGRPVASATQVASNPSIPSGQADPRLSQPTGYDFARGTADPNASAPQYNGQAYNDPRAANVQFNASYPDPNRGLATTSVYPPSTSQTTAVTTLQRPQPETRVAQTSGVSTQPTNLDRSTYSASDVSAGYGATRPRGDSVIPREEPKGPLFNILLLVSIVGNLYLFFWLKNLRYRFRDLVAAKRVMSSSSSPA